MKLRGLVRNNDSETVCLALDITDFIKIVEVLDYINSSGFEEGVPRKDIKDNTICLLEKINSLGERDLKILKIDSPIKIHL